MPKEAGSLSSSKACLLFANDDLSEKRGLLCKAAARAMLQAIGIPMLRSVARARASGRTRLALPSVICLPTRRKAVVSSERARAAALS